MGQLKFSMNGFRSSLTSDMKELREEIEESLKYLDEELKESLIDRFDTVACSVNSLNHVWVEGNDDFSNMADAPEIPLLGNYDE